MAITSTETDLAVNGGSPVRSVPWPPRRLFGEEEKQAAVRLFDKSIATGNEFGYGGEEEILYCREFAEYHGGGFADGVSSGSAAVYVALMTLDLEPFTEVIVPPTTDPGGIMPATLLNLIPIPADSAPGSYNMNAETIKARLSKRTSAIIVGHITGAAADMDPIIALAKQAGVPILEDCSQAHGAEYKGTKVGTFGDIAAFSTMSGKHHASAAQGGMVYTRNETLFRRCLRASDRGKPFGLPAGSTNEFAALNLNSNDLAAAVGRVQLRKLPSILERRRRSAEALARGCESLQAVSIPTGPAQSRGAYWFITPRLELDKLRVGKFEFVAALAAEGNSVNPEYNFLPSTHDWYVNKRVFGTSGYPWRCPLYKASGGDPDAVHPIPNIVETVRVHFKLNFHENCGQKEVDDTLAALAKVEAAYLK